MSAAGRDADLLPALEAFAKEARHELGIVARNTAFALIGAAVLAILIANAGGGGFAALPFLLVLGYTVVAYALRSRNYRSRFKVSVIEPIVKRADPSLTYNPNGFIGQHEFSASRLILEHPDRYSGDDLIQGRIGETAIRFSEVHAERRRVTRDARGNTRTEWQTIFRGTIVIADFNKQFHGETYVLPDTAQRFLGGLGQSLQSFDRRRGELVRLEDPGFERLFAVYSSDQVEARYILSTSLMQRILDYRTRADRAISLSFVQSQLFVAIPSRQDHLAPPSLLLIANLAGNARIRSIVLERLREYEAYIAAVTGIVADLNLNTRIWGA